MSEPHVQDGRLDSWKDIATYLRRDIRTVMRWQEKGLPVHRVPGGKRQAVFAYRAEIDDWLDGKAANGLSDTIDPSEILPPDIQEPLDRDSLSAIKTPRLTKAWRYVVASLLALAVPGLLVAFRFSQPDSVPQVTRTSRLSHDGLFKWGLATDGANVYFSEVVDGKLQLSWMRADGGTIHRIATPFSKAVVEAISPDGGELLVRGWEGTEDERPLWIVPVNGLPPRKVGRVFCHAATLTPDGKGIAYSNGNSIFLTFDEGATVRLLTRFEQDPYDLYWSTAPNRLLVTLRNPTTAEFSLSEIELGNDFEVRAIAPSPSAPQGCCLDWTSSGGYEFLARSEGTLNPIWADAIPSQWWPRRRAQPVKFMDSLGTLSALASDSRMQKLYVISTDPSRSEFVRFEPFSKTLKPFLPGLSALYLDFSRDGKWITYSSFDDFSLWVGRADGTNLRQLTFSFRQVELPQWSPDSTIIAFTAKKPGHPWRIYVIPRDGGEPKEASSGNDNQGAPTWSPDGKRLAYANVVCQEGSECAVHLIELATGKVTTLPGSAGLRTSRWSPDGRYIAALRPSQHQLLLFDIARQTWSVVADSIFGDDLTWSPDSKYLYSNRPIGTQPGIFRIALASGALQSVVDLELLSKLSGKLDTGLYVAPDHSVILSRQINASDIYALEWEPR